jgi:hydroxymethylbilane synthase
MIAEQLEARTGRPVSLIRVSTRGDECDAPIEQLGSTGVFVTALREALMRGEVDVVVHSCKDLPADDAPGLRIAAFPEREDPRDALVCAGAASLDRLPRGARIGTGSPRRAAQLLAAGHEPRILPMRGNVDTRLRKLADGSVDALVLAMAGLTRLGRSDVPATPLATSVLMPAPAQGALAVECRADDEVTSALAGCLDHGSTRAVVTAERGFLAALGAGCTAPVGALGELVEVQGVEPMVRLVGVVAAPDGSSVIRAEITGPVANGARVGRRLAHSMLREGAASVAGLCPRPHPVTPTSR